MQKALKLILVQLKQSKFILILLFSLLTFKSEGQSRVNTVFELGISADAYKGDLSSNYAIFYQGIHFGFKSNKKKMVLPQLNFSIGKFGSQNSEYVFIAQDHPEHKANNFFINQYKAVDLGLEFIVFDKFNLRIYISPSIGLMKYDIKDRDGNSLLINKLTRSKNEIAENFSAYIPLRLGARYFFKNNFGAGFQTGITFFTTDYIDNIGSLSNYSGRDNVLSYQFNFYIPIK